MFRKIVAKVEAYFLAVIAFLKNKWYRYQLTRWLLIVFLSITLLLSLYLTFIAKTADVKNLRSNLSQTTTIYDKDGDKAGYLYAQKGTWVSLDQISPNVPNAVLATEDRNFYQEYGFSIKGILRASLVNVKNKLLRNHTTSAGGSTLTQQLVKNALLTQEQTMTRKIKELFLSIQVENDYSKKQILAMYLNKAYFGSGVWGVEDAAQKYFGVHASQLTVPQSAMLAGILKNPTAYNPRTSPEAAKQRRNVVLGLMATMGVINENQLSVYQSSALTLRDTYESKSGYKYPYYFDAVINEAISKYGLTENQIMNDGYKIYTSLDQRYQTSMQSAFKNESLFPYDATDGTEAQGAAIAMNPKNGGVFALVGGRDSKGHTFRGYNRATQLSRSPGSTMKPLAVYTPALESGYSYDSIIQDKYQSYGKNQYTPKNWNSVYQGNIRLYQALALSKNTSAVWLLNKIGVTKGYDSVEKFGINLAKSDENLSLALGGMKKGVSPYQMASAYTAFANNGQRYSPHLITKIVDSSGKVIIDNENPDSSQVMSAKVAKNMTSMMIDVYSQGTGQSAKPAGYTIAGKTGTTEGVNGNDGDTDHWYIGYTKDVVLATWTGFDSNNYSLEDEGTRGGSALFKAVMGDILPYTQNTYIGVKAASTRLAQRQAEEDKAYQDNSNSSNVGSRINDTLNDWGSRIKDAFGGLFN
ncbi:PBP1A family penicillin-binding protein [Ligilactobacillus equi]